MTQRVDSIMVFVLLDDILLGKKIILSNKDSVLVTHSMGSVLYCVLYILYIHANHKIQETRLMQHKISISLDCCVNWTLRRPPHFLFNKKARPIFFCPFMCLINRLRQEKEAELEITYISLLEQDVYVFLAY